MWLLGDIFLLEGVCCCEVYLLFWWGHLLFLGDLLLVVGSVIAGGIYFTAFLVIINKFHTNYFAPKKMILG